MNEIQANNRRNTRRENMKIENSMPRLQIGNRHKQKEKKCYSTTTTDEHVAAYTILTRKRLRLRVRERVAFPYTHRQVVRWTVLSNDMLQARDWEWVAIPFAQYCALHQLISTRYAVHSKAGSRRNTRLSSHGRNCCHVWGSIRGADVYQRGTPSRGTKRNTGQS